MANSDPILVPGYESDTWIGDFSLTHLVGPIVYLDPPLAAVRSAQVPLITSMHTFCFCRLKTAAHCVEHVLRRRIYVTGRGGHCCAQANRSTDRRKEAPLSFQLLSHFVIRASHSLGLIAQFALEEKRHPEM